jgi:hypothetical protein
LLSGFRPNGFQHSLNEKEKNVMQTLCQDQKEAVVAKLTAVLKDVPADDVDGVLASARTRLTEDAKKVKRADLEKLFDTQIATLKDRGCPEQILTMLANQRGDVVSKASQMTLKEGRISFLPVIPRLYLSIYSQMAMVRNGNKAGYTYLNPSQITDVVETPREPYYIFDIEDGEAMRGKAPRQAEKEIKKDGRRGLTEVEVIALGIHTDVLSRHYVDAVGSRYDSDSVPDLCVSDGRPKLDWGDLGDGNDHWGGASCGSK